MNAMLMALLKKQMDPDNLDEYDTNDREMDAIGKDVPIDNPIDPNTIPQVSSPFDDLKKPSESLNAYKQHLSEMPDAQAYEPSTGKKIIAGIGAALAGAANPRDSRAGDSFVANLRNPYNRAMSQWKMRGEGIKDIGVMEDKTLDNKLNVTKTEEQIKGSKEARELAREKFQSEQEFNEYKKTRDTIEDQQKKQEFDRRTAEDGSQSAIAWYNAHSSRMNAETAQKNAETKATVAGNKVDRKQEEINERNEALDDLISKAEAAKALIAKRGKSILGAHKTAQAGQGPMGFVKKIPGLSDFVGSDADANELRRLSAEFMAHRGFAEGGKALTGPELAIFRAILPEADVIDPEAYTKKVDAVIERANRLKSDPYSERDHSISASKLDAKRKAELDAMVP